MKEVLGGKSIEFQNFIKLINKRLLEKELAYENRKHKIQG